jgi:hypothetical protein
MRAVPIEELSREWPRVESWIADAVAYNAGDEGVLDVLIALARGVYTLWVADRFAAVTQVQRHPKQTVWLIAYAGGEDMDSARHALDFARLHAKTHGIDMIRVHGRPGWESMGLKKVGVILQVTP